MTEEVILWWEGPPPQSIFCKGGGRAHHHNPFLQREVRGPPNYGKYTYLKFSLTTFKVPCREFEVPCREDQLLGSKSHLFNVYLQGNHQT